MCKLTLSDGEAFSALCSAAGQDFASVCGLHSLSKAVDFFALTLFGLIGTEHNMHSFRFYTQHRERGYPKQLTMLENTAVVPFEDYIL